MLSVLATGLAPPAWGHEFGLVLVVATSGERQAGGADAQDGFRLGVDESPDVSLTAVSIMVAAVLTRRVARGRRVGAQPGARPPQE